MLIRFFLQKIIAEGTISTVVDEIIKTGKLPKPKAEPVAEAIPVTFKIEQPLTSEKIGEVKVAGLRSEEAAPATSEDAMAKRVADLAASLEKLTKLVAGL